MSSNRADEWKKIAKDLYSALLRVSVDCQDSHHDKNQYHGDNEPCPVFEMTHKAMENYQNKNQQEKLTL